MNYKKIIFYLVFVALSSSCSSNNRKQENNSDHGTGTISSITEKSHYEINANSDEGKTGELSTINFSYNSYGINVEAREILNKNAIFLNKNKTIQIRIEGHCDERGGSQFNLALGEKRASFIRNQLIELGVDKDRMIILSLGKESPLSFGHDEISWGKNRRANFVITHI